VFCELFCPRFVRETVRFRASCCTSSTPYRPVVSRPFTRNPWYARTPSPAPKVNGLSRTSTASYPGTGFGCDCQLFIRQNGHVRTQRETHVPANLTPAYKTAEGRFRGAKEPQERLDALKEMLRAIPKHKGTDHLQADIKAKIKELTEELAGPRKGGAKTGPATVVKPNGAGQIALVGPPNSGKSTLHTALTGSHAHIGDYPFTTQFPMPGMMPVHDVAIQIVDLPPISPEHPVPWISNALHPADGCMLVVDLSQPGCVERVIALHDLLAQRRVLLTEIWPVHESTDDIEYDPFTKVLPTLLVASKCDRLDESGEELAVLEELAEVTYPCISVSAETGVGVEELGRWLFDRLGVIRVYTKAPGKEPEMERPYTVRKGSTVHDVALLIHRDIAEGLHYARAWGASEYDAQQVGADHIVEDGDVLELHW
jgi:ribosome-interacting GTPase 1